MCCILKLYLLGSPVTKFITPKEQERSGGTANLTSSIVLAGVGSYLADYLRTRRAKIFIKVNSRICDSQAAYCIVLEGLFVADARLHPKYNLERLPHGMWPLPCPWLRCSETTQNGLLGHQGVGLFCSPVL